MAGQDEHAYSLDHPQPPHSAKFNSRRDNSHEGQLSTQSDPHDTEIRQRTGLDLIPAPPFNKTTLEQAVASDLWPRN